MRDIQLVLERWGGWVASGGDNIGYPNVAAGLKRLLPANGRSRVSCCDGDGLLVSSAAACLKKKDPYLHTLIEWHYVKCMPVRAIGVKMGISHTQVLKRLQAAEGFIDGCLAMLGIELEMDIFVQHEKVHEKFKIA